MIDGMLYRATTTMRKEADTMERQDKGLAYLLQYEWHGLKTV